MVWYYLQVYKLDRMKVELIDKMGDGISVSMIVRVYPKIKEKTEFEEQINDSFVIWIEHNHWSFSFTLYLSFRYKGYQCFFVDN